MARSFAGKIGSQGRLLPMVLAAAVGGAALLPGATATSTARGPAIAAIVQAVPGATGAAERAVIRLGGHIGRRLGLINGFSAELPAGGIEQLRATPGIAGVTADLEHYRAFAARRTDRKSSLAGVSLSSDIELPPARYCYRIFDGCQARRLMTITDRIDRAAL